ncbi:uncharacterized protein LOC126740816 isoform X2 [Anthonomus grandis grandis]|uniref:uncharacterized protein LOC126740816 isoform X2 n=1 Tax=Anthonomus grandis grandis TaxID=2921223 RepID=UPI002165E512|nr:uncharacterized protein LOC126740816 isoform X2 [Anthonomus grandis grandis]
MMEFNFFGSMTKLNFGKGRSKSQRINDPNKSVERQTGEVSHPRHEKAEEGKSTLRRFFSLTKLNTDHSKDIVLKSTTQYFDDFDNTVDQVPAVNEASGLNEITASEYTDEEEVERRDKFESQNTTFYKVLTKSFYDEHLHNLNKFQKHEGGLKSSTKRDKKLTKNLKERKLVISSPQNFQRVENDIINTLRREAEKIGPIKKSASLDNLLRDFSEDSDDIADDDNEVIFSELARGKLEISASACSFEDQQTQANFRFEMCECGEEHRVVPQPSSFLDRTVSVNNNLVADTDSSDSDYDGHHDSEPNLVVMRNMSQSTPELLKSINQVPKDRSDRPKENKFPLDDDVKLRRKPEIRNNRLSKTTDYDSNVRKRNNNIITNTKNFDIRGIMKIDLPTGSVLTKWKEEYISYENENFYRINEKTKNKELLYFNVAIKSIRYPKSKESKEVEIRDNKSIFMLHFQELKYARQFMENDRIQDYLVDNKHTIKKTLLRFLGKRSSIEILEKKGIYKNENIFANTLAKIYNKSGLLVPMFIYEVIQLVELPENITTLGIYRTSGNLAIIQKIRCEVDNGRLNILSQYAKDPDVLTGSLKLFFRELKEPLISPDVCEKLLELTKTEPAKMSSKDHTRIRSVLIKNLHEANLETFAVLMKHLIEVAKYKEYNKMDAYNLAICWGPTMIFSAHPETLTPATIELSKDIVAQSHDATKLVDFLLGYYELYPAELASLGRGPKLESESERLHLLGRQDSKDSMDSYDSMRSKKSGSSVSLSVDEITKRLVEYIEPQISTEGLYLKQGSTDKTSKIIKKLNKKKINELEKYKNDVLELAEALKKYLKDQDCLVTPDALESVLRISPDSSYSCLEPATRRKLISQIEDTPKKDTLIFLLRHLAKVLEYQESSYGVPKNQLLTIWTNVLNNQKKTKTSNEEFEKFLSVAVKVFNDNLPDVVRSSFNNNGNSPNRNGSMNELFKEMKMQHHFQSDQTDRNSRYDNVDSDVGEASILEETEEKTEQTKL